MLRRVHCWPAICAPRHSSFLSFSFHIYKAGSNPEFTSHRSYRKAFDDNFAEITAATLSSRPDAILVRLINNPGLAHALTRNHGRCAGKLFACFISMAAPRRPRHFSISYAYERRLACLLCWLPAPVPASLWLHRRLVPIRRQINSLCYVSRLSHRGAFGHLDL